MTSRDDQLRLGLQATMHLDGEVWECGVFQGDGAAALEAELDRLGSPRILRLFDTFGGMPISGPYDIHKVGSMSDTSEERVRARFAASPSVHIHVGTMPSSFASLEPTLLSLANIDVDNYDSVLACLSFVYPRTQRGGYIFIDDYGCGSCPGACRAVSEFMVGKPEQLVVAGNRSAQAWVVKL